MELQDAFDAGFDAVKAYVDKSFAGFERRFAQMEKYVREMPVPKDGTNGIDGKSITLDDLAPMISAEVERTFATIPVPKDGVDGTAGTDGKSVMPDDLAPMIAEEVAKAFGEIRIPEDGKAGEDGKSIDPAAVQAMVDAAVAAMPPAEKGKDADPAATAAMIKAEVERAVAALPVPQDGKSVTLDDLRPVIAEAVAAIPVPKDGEPGKDGRDGLDVVKFMRDDRGHLNGILRDGTTVDLGEYIGKDGAPGIAGKDGVDGVGFDDMSCEIRDDGVYLVWEKGEVVKEARLPIPLDRGVFKEGQTYRAGDAVTWGGSLWIAQGETTEKPDLSKDWRLSVKRGRDGKDAGDIKPKTKPVKG